MKTIVRNYGLTAGFLASAVLILGSYFNRHSTDMVLGMVVGYTSFVICSAIIIYGMYKLKKQGYVRFKPLFIAGLLMSLIMSVMYTLSWLIFYHTVNYDPMAHYAAYMEQTWAGEGLNGDALEAKRLEFTQQMENYKKPHIMVLYTMLEIFPIAFLISALAALVLMLRKPKSSPDLL